ncbi:MAG: hypothetical protein JST01_17925 [Cyanobacteria bacterium SZAS TMP-1]|nr:hypothetical protein [Cyanobacteria bacterium SZAS TMP-1]
MGMDSIELVLEIEQEFGIEIPDNIAEQITTVGEMYEFLKERLHSTPPAHCMTQRMFYKVRKAITDNYAVPKQSITLDTKLKDLAPAQELKDAWPFLDLFAELDFPKLDKNWWPIGLRMSTDVLTLRELLTAMTTLNAEKLLLEPGSDEEIWVRLTKVIQRQLNVELREIQPDASFTKDLGVD